MVNVFLCGIRPGASAAFEVRRVARPRSTSRISARCSPTSRASSGVVWLFSLVLGQDQGQGRAVVPLHPRGFLPRTQLPYREISTASSASGSIRSPIAVLTRPRTGSSASISPRNLQLAASHSWSMPGRASPGAAGSPRTAWCRWTASLRHPRHYAARRTTQRNPRNLHT